MGNELASPEATAAFGERLRRVENSLQNTLKHYHRTKTRIEGDKARFLLDTGIFSAIESCIDDESQLIVRLQSFTQNEDHPPTVTHLETCRTIVENFDQAASKAKWNVGLYLRGAPLGILFQAELRAMFRMHRKLATKLKALDEPLRGFLADIVYDLQQDLQPTNFLFVIFMGYAHKDVARRDEFLNAVEEPIKNEGYFIWWDRHLVGSEQWHAKIRTQIMLCDLAVVLVTENFLKSEYIQRVEVADMDRQREQFDDDQIEFAIRKRTHRGMQIFPIIVNDCPWQEHKVLKVNQWEPTAKSSMVRGFRRIAQRQLYYRETVAPQIIEIMNRLSDPDQTRKLLQAR